jgi:hypothetical protein
MTAPSADDSRNQMRKMHILLRCLQSGLRIVRGGRRGPPRRSTAALRQVWERRP